MRHKLFMVMAALTALSAASTAYSAVPIGVAGDVRVSTLGFGPELNVGVGKYFGVRVGYSTGSFNPEEDDGQLNYQLHLKMKNTHVIGDLYPFSGGFHLSAGLVNTGTDITAVMTGSKNPDPTLAPNEIKIGNNSYQSNQIGTVQGNAGFKSKNAAYFGLGWGNSARKDKRFTFTTELGVVRIGDRYTTLSGSCGTLAGAACTQFRSDVALQEVKLRDKINSTKWWPVLSLGIGIRFY